MWIFIALSIVSIGLFLFLDSRKPRNFPPGPEWLPIVGSALALRKERSLTGYFYSAALSLSKKYSNSGVVGLRVGKDRIVIASTLEACKEMLLNEDIDGRPNGIFYTARTWNIRKGIVLVDGDLWKVQRRFILRHLKEFGYGRRGMFDIVHSEAEQLLMDVREKCVADNNNSAIVSMNELFSVYVLNTLWFMLAGIRYSPADEELKVLQGLLFELFKNIDMIGAMFSHFPILKYVAPEMSGYNSFLHIHQKIWKFLSRELEKHESLMNLENEDRDFMDAFIRIMMTSKDLKYFDRLQLLAVCMDLFMAGTETTSKSMGFAFLNLIKNQEVQKKARQEIDTIVGRDRLPTIDDRVNMPYNEAIVLESIRHFMGRTFGIPHRSLRDTDLCGYTVPKDAIVLTNYHGILLSEQHFKDPYSFRPERFLVNGKVFVPEVFFPFGLGKHRCMGESLAKTNVFIFMVTMLQNFEFKPMPGEDLPSDLPLDGATPSVRPYNALVLPRQR